MRTILVTGASGFLGHNLVKSLLRNGDFYVIAILGRPEDKANELPKDDNLKVLTLTEFFNLSIEGVDSVVNCAFARSNNPGLLAGALKFTSDLILKLRLDDVKSVINISTQGVYKRINSGSLATEVSEIEPMDGYALAKYASEQLFVTSKLPFVTNVRMASINMPQRFLNFFVQKVKNGEDISITTPKQPAALIDVRDAAEALTAIVEMQPENRSDIYNLGTGFQMTILDYAKKVIEIGSTKGYKSTLIIEDNDKCSGAGMDCSLIKKDCSWEPRITVEQMISEFF